MSRSAVPVADVPRVDPGSSARTSARPPGTRVGALAAAVACLVLGVAVVVVAAALGFPLLAPAAALALLAVPLLLVRPVFVLVLATVTEFANLSTVAAEIGLPGG